MSVEWTGAQTGIKEPDKAFIMLERFQRDAGAGRGAWSDGNPAAERVDWLRRLMRGEEGGGARLQVEERKWDIKIV